MVAKSRGSRQPTTAFASSSRKELASYEAEQPWRELLHEDTAVTQVPDDDQHKAKADKKPDKPAAEPNTIR